MDAKQALISDILSSQQDIQNIRARERQVQKVEKTPRNAMEAHMAGIVSPELMPSNVGDISKVQWGFFHQVNMDFGTNPTFNSNSRTSKIVKVSSEAAYLITRIYRDTDDAGLAGYEAPLTLTIRDLQSSRQLMDRGIPLQVIPSKGEYYELPVPFLLYPASSAELELKCWLPVGVSLPTSGSGTQNFTLYGAKVRTSDLKSLAKNAFKI